MILVPHVLLRQHLQRRGGLLAKKCKWPNVAESRNGHKSRRLSTTLLHSCCKIMFSWTLSNTSWVDSVDRTCTLSDMSKLAISSESNYYNIYLTLPLLNIITTKWPFALATRTAEWGDMIFVLASLLLFCVCCTSAVNKEWSAACTNEYLFK